MKKVLVQACCGPCACALFDTDGLKECELGLFFNGDNFNTAAEYERRYAAFCAVARHLGALDVICEQYNPRVFADCAACIGYRLEKCAFMAKINDFDAFTTTLTVSPHKDTAMVNDIGRAIGARFGIEFIELDLKRNNGFAKSVARSKDFGLYRQNYCGCAKSVRQ